MPTELQETCPHACGMCDGVYVPSGHEGRWQTWTCERCGHWHIAKDCCEEAT